MQLCTKTSVRKNQTTKHSKGVAMNDRSQRTMLQKNHDASASGREGTVVRRAAWMAFLVQAFIPSHMARCMHH